MCTTLLKEKKHSGGNNWAMCNEKVTSGYTLKMYHHRGYNGQEEFQLLYDESLICSSRIQRTNAARDDHFRV